MRSQRHPDDCRFLFEEQPRNLARIHTFLAWQEKGVPDNGDVRWHSTRASSLATSQNLIKHTVPYMKRTFASFLSSVMFGSWDSRPRKLDYLNNNGYPSRNCGRCCICLPGPFEFQVPQKCAEAVEHVHQLDGPSGELFKP